MSDVDNLENANQQLLWDASQNIEGQLHGVHNYINSGAAKAGIGKHLLQDASAQSPAQTAALLQSQAAVIDQKDNEMLQWCRCQKVVLAGTTF